MSLHWTGTSQTVPPRKIPINQNDNSGVLSDPETPEDERKNVFGGNYMPTEVNCLILIVGVDVMQRPKVLQLMDILLH